MAKTTEMKLLEMIVLKQDIKPVIAYLGKKGTFQFQSQTDTASSSKKNDSDEFALNESIFSSLKNAAATLGIKVTDTDLSDVQMPSQNDVSEANHIIAAFTDLTQKNLLAKADLEKKLAVRRETLAFANLQVSYSEIEHLSFISLSIGKLDPAAFDSLKNQIGDKGVVAALGEDKSYILVAASKQHKAETDAILKDAGFVPVEIPTDFSGVPEDVLSSLESEVLDAQRLVEEMDVQLKNFSDTHSQKIISLLKIFFVGTKIDAVEKSLESTELAYRITGWIPASQSGSYMTELDEITEGRIALRQYEPKEVPSVISGRESVPVKLTHGRFVRSFERMIFSYGSPLYGTIDPTPFVAIFFTLLFGIMFGDLGQGLVFLLAGILMATKVIKVGGWNKFAPIFMAIGISSSVMGLVTGEFFSNETLLEPFAYWVTGLFGNPHAPILKMMPSSDPSSIKAMFGVFGVAVAIGFVINSIGLVINLVNNIIRRKWADVFFGKNGIAGILFFWYTVALILRIVLLGHKIAAYDWIVIGVSLFFAAFAEPFERAIEGEKPLFENGFGTYLISGIVELIEVVSGYLSNSISFVRVGAFALSHAVLDFLILTLTELVGGVGGIFVLIIGNIIIIVLEGMIVAIQVIRLQYYEFFSKFFNETGREFKPFTFVFEG